MQVQRVQNNSYNQNFGQIKNTYIRGDLNRLYESSLKNDILRALKQNETIQKYCNSKDVDIEIGKWAVMTGVASVTDYAWVSITEAFKEVKGNPFKKFRNFMKYILNHEGIYIYSDNDTHGDKLLLEIHQIYNNKKLMEHHRYRTPEFMNYFY